jgi:hypothetical protein
VWFEMWKKDRTGWEYRYVMVSLDVSSPLYGLNHLTWQVQWLVNSFVYLSVGNGLGYSHMVTALCVLGCTIWERRRYAIRSWTLPSCSVSSAFTRLSPELFSYGDFQTSVCWTVHLGGPSDVCLFKCSARRAFTHVSWTVQLGGHSGMSPELLR